MSLSLLHTWPQKQNHTLCPNTSQCETLFISTLTPTVIGDISPMCEQLERQWGPITPVAVKYLMITMWLSSQAHIMLRGLDVQASLAAETIFSSTWLLGTMTYLELGKPFICRNFYSYLATDNSTFLNNGARFLYESWEREQEKGKGGDKE